MRLVPAVLVAALLAAILPAAEPVDYVNPLVGTGSATTPSALKHSESDTEPRGQTFPAVGVPWGMTQWAPQTQATEKKCVSPFYHQDERIQGFRGSHWMSGSCTQDYGSVTILPMRGTPRFLPGEAASHYSSQEARPDYYRVRLDDHRLGVEVAGVSRSGILRFQVESDDPLWFVLMVNSDEGEGAVEVLEAANEVTGSNPAHRIYQGWGKPAGFSGHFVARFQQPIAEQRREADAVAVRIAAKPGDEVVVKIGTSFTSTDQARNNLQAEIPEWDFDGVRRKSCDAWNQALGAVRVTGGSATDREIFYTALYHAMLLPRVFNDVDGSYVGFADDDSNHTAEGYSYHVDFSLWDTYRAVHPLLTLVAPNRAAEMVRSLLDKAEQGGWLPTFPSWNSYTSAMIGDHAFPVIVDAWRKGLGGFDAERAFGLMYRNATRTPGREEYVDGKGRRALAVYRKHGYLPLEEPVEDAFHKGEQVSRTLEYAFDDFVLAQMAKELGKKEAYEDLTQRAGSWKNVIDPETGFARGRHADGRWVEPFDPYAIRSPFITEGSPAQYTWTVPHDMAGLMTQMGGRTLFIKRLDTLFERGEYWHGNEPNHHIAWLYNYAGQPWKTQEIVRRIIREEYGAGPGGLSGNDDAGQMSAWLAFAAMGLYPVAPGEPYYVLGSPMFESVELSAPGGKSFRIVADGASEKNLYIQSATLNGAEFNRPWIRHSEISSGGELRFVVGPKPNKSWGASKDSAPPSMSAYEGW